MLSCDNYANIYHKSGGLDAVFFGISVADVITRTVRGLPPVGTLEFKESIQLYSGGCAMSAAVDFAILGGSCALITRLGGDGFGEYLHGVMKSKGVDVSAVRFVPDTPSSASVVLVDEAGERTFMHCTGVNETFTAADADWELIDRTGLVFFGGNLLMPGFDGEVCASVLRECKRRGKFVAFDTAWDYSGKWMRTLRPCFESIDLFMPSIDEAMQIFGLPGESLEDYVKIADCFYDLGVRSVVIKLGKRGCYVQPQPGRAGTVLPTYTDIKPVCTTGAGDSFCAGFLYGLVRGWDLLVCGRFANAVGTHCIMKTGAISGMVPAARVLEFMALNAPTSK